MDQSGRTDRWRKPECYRGTLAIEGLNARYNALTSISSNAEVSLDNTQGLGRGNIANDGLLTLKNVTGELRNSISGKGIVSATAVTDVELDGDNSRFVGQFNIDTGSALSVNEQKNPVMLPLSIMACSPSPLSVAGR